MAGGIEHLKQRIDAYQREHAWLGFPIAVGKKSGEDNASQFAALIAYYGFFSLFPLLMVAYTILGFVLQGNDKLRGDIARTLREQFPIPGISVDTIKGSGIALAIGVVLALWSGLSATQAAINAVNGVWDVPRGEQPNFLKKRLLGIGILMVIAVGLVAASLAGSMARWLGPAAGIGGIVLSVVINGTTIAALFRVMADRALSWAEVRVGAVVGGISWTVLQEIGGWYTQRLVQNADKTYGTFAVVIGLLSWIYLQATVFVYAAEISSVSSRRLWPRSLGTDTTTDADRAVQQALIEQAKLPT